MPSPDTRRWLANGFIAAFIASQIWLPLSYYLGNDPFDERFAWRMFSPVRLAKCSVQAYDYSDGSRTPIRLSAEVHHVWIKLLRRARQPVIDKVAETLCERRSQNGMADIRMAVQCIPPDAVTKGVCSNPTDRDRDGVPDGYQDSRHCGELSPMSCFKRDCGDRDIATCSKDICEVRPVEESTPLCGDSNGV